jgi:hypothetical protein
MRTSCDGVCAVKQSMLSEAHSADQSEFAVRKLQIDAVMVLYLRSKEN